MRTAESRVRVELVGVLAAGRMVVVGVVIAVAGGEAIVVSFDAYPGVVRVNSSTRGRALRLPTGVLASSSGDLV